MQRHAARVLATRIKPGMTFQQVLDILGPGSAGWPAVENRKLQPEDTVGFNVRSDYNNGIDVGFRDGRVTSVFCYDFAYALQAKCPVRHEPCSHTSIFPRTAHVSRQPPQ